MRNQVLRGADLQKISETPPFVMQVLEENALLGISASGGKDSDAMLRYLDGLSNWNRFGLFCDLGRIEWPGTTEHLRRVCTSLDLDLLKLFPKRSMVDEWDFRYQTILSKDEDKPFWSSAASRYCTKHMKEQSSNALLRQSVHQLMICAIGLRAEELPFGELVVEIATSLVCDRLGLGLGVKQASCQLTDDWMKLIKTDKHCFLRAAGQANKLSNLLLSNAGCHERVD